MVDQFSFPKEQPNFYTRISLRKYSRPRPGASTNINLQSTIRLPLPQGVTDSYAMDINDTKLDLLGNSLGDVYAAGKSRAEDYVKQYNGGRGALSIIKEIGLQGAAVTPGISDTGVGKFAQAETGLIRNPHLTTIFEGVRIKSYAFTWKLSPRSQDEAYEMERLINYIKTFMHPQVIGGGFALEYPYLANVQFEAGNNQTMPNVKDSFITRMEINNAAGGTMAFFRDGKSVALELTLGFQEINIQTRDDFVNQFAAGPTL